MEQKLDLSQVAEKARSQGGVDVRSRQLRFNVEHQTFIGKDFVKWLFNSKIASHEYHAEEIAKEMFAEKYFVGLNADAFMNGPELYRFKEHEVSNTETETWHKVSKDLDG
jgi:hypothetical protein